MEDKTTTFQDMNYYEILGVQTDATDKEIKDAYYQLIRENHPDKNLNKEHEANERSKKIIEAYKTLSDPNLRRQYDQELAAKEQTRTEEFPDSFASRPGRGRMSNEELIQEVSKILEAYRKEHERRRALGEQLVIAIFQEKWNEVNELINQGADPDCPFTPRIAYQYGVEIQEIKSYLLGWRPLHFAVSFGNLKLLNILLEQGANPNAQTTDKMFSPLHLAAHKGDLKAVINLVQKGAYPHFTTRKGNTPLHIAIDEGKKAVALYLIDNPSETRNPFTTKMSSNNRKNAAGETPLERAIIKAQQDESFWEVANKLLERPDVHLSLVDISKIYQLCYDSISIQTSALLQRRQEFIEWQERQNQNNCLVM